MKTTPPGGRSGVRRRGMAGFSFAIADADLGEDAGPDLPSAAATTSGATTVGPLAVAHVLASEAGLLDEVAGLLEGAGFLTRTFSDPAVLLAAVADLPRGCIVAEVPAGGLFAASLMRELQARGCRFPVVALTPAADVPAAVRAMKAGAADAVPLPVVPADLRAAVQGAIALLARDSSLAELRRRMERLTRREQQVLEGLVRGDPNKAIAHELGISRRTVEAHRANVMEKLGCRSLSQIVHLALRLGLAPA